MAQALVRSRFAPSAWLSRLLPLCAGGALLLSSSVAQADPTSWLSVGLGGAQLSFADQDSKLKLAMPINIGVGTSPAKPISIGVGARMATYFGEGTDWATYLRAATQGYAIGSYGIAIDAGAYTRSFAGGSSGFLGVLNVGVPWGGVVSVMYERGSNDGQMVGATIGIDLLRLTVYRLAGEEQWVNVNPAYRPQ